MAEDVRIRLIVDGREVVATLGDVDDTLDKIVDSGDDAEQAVDSWADKAEGRSADVVQSYEQVSRAQQDMAFGTTQSASQVSSLENSFSALQQTAALSSTDLQNASFATESLATTTAKTNREALQLSDSMGSLIGNLLRGDEIDEDLERVSATLAEAEGGASGLLGQLSNMKNLMPLLVGGAVGLATAFGPQLIQAMTQGREAVEEYREALDGLLSVQNNAVSGEISLGLDDAEERLEQAIQFIEEKTPELERLRQRIANPREAPSRDVFERRDTLQDDLDRAEATRARLQEQVEQGRLEEKLFADLGGDTQVVGQQLEEIESQLDSTLSTLEDDFQRGLIDQEELLASQEQATLQYARSLRELDQQFSSINLSGPVDEAFSDVLALREQLEELRAPDAPDAPPLPTLDAIEDRLIEFEGVDFDQALELSALADMELRFQRINELTDEGILTGLEADRQKIRAAREALEELQRRALEGEDVGSAQIEQVRAALAALEEDSAEATEEGASSGLARGIAQGAQQGFQQEFQPLVQQIEDDVARAFISAMLQALASAAAKQLAQLGGGSEEDDGISGGDVLSAALQVAGAVLFDRGGFTGDGPRMEPAGIVHRGEYVIPKPVVDQTGPRFWQEMTSLQGFAGGGFAGPSASSSSSGGGADLAGEIRALRQEMRQMQERPVTVRVGRRTSRDIGERGSEYQRRKSARGGS